MDHSMFMPHGWCMTWNPWLIGLHVSTDALVALSYYSIPAALFYVVWSKKTTLKLQPILILFGLFIALCGAGHAIDIVSIWKPVYWFKGFWNLATASASVVTAIVLIPRTLEFLKLPEKAERLGREADELRERRATLQTVIDSVEEGIILLDSAGNTALRNPAADALLRTSPNLMEWREHKPTDQDTWRSPDGRVIERFTTGAARIGQLYVLRDLTSRMTAWQAQLRLERVISSMKQGFALISLKSDSIVQTNASFDTMHCAPVESALHRTPDSIFAGTPEERRRRFEEIRAACEGTDFWDGETRHVRADGSEFFCSSRYNLYREDGQAYLSSIHFDITEQKRIEVESARVEARLLQTAKLQSLGVLAGGVAHDFNNLLTGILGNTSLALEYLERGAPLYALLENATQAAERAASLTNQLLAYSGKGRFVVEPVRLTELARVISGLVQLSIPPTVKLTIVDNPSLPLTEVDVAQMQQLIMNLIINGAEAVGEAQGTVTVRGEAATITVADRQQLFPLIELEPGEYVRLDVVDTGCGMDEATMEQIFDPFFTTKFTGRGLGLAAAQGIVRGHRGAMRVQSEVGVGSKFSVYLPALASPGRTAAGESKKSAEAHPGKGTVLVVDDEELVRSAARQALTHYGYRVIEAHDGLEGLREFEAGRAGITLVLLDMTMPVMSGEETLKRLRELDPKIPVLLMSGYSEMEAVSRFSDKSVSGFLQKPFTAQMLSEKVKAAKKNF